MSRKVLLVVLAALALAILAACGGASGPTPPDGAATAPAKPAAASTAVAAAGDAASLLSSGQAKLTAGNYDGAIADLQASVSKGKSLDGYFALGNAYTRQSKLAEAEQAYNEALKINPNHLSTLSNLGVVYYQQGKLEDARRTFERALAVGPNDAATYYLLGATQLQLKDLAGAEKSMQKALELKPQMPEALFGMAMLRKQQGRTQDAIAGFEAFLNGPPAQDPQARAEAEKMLKELKGQ